MCAGAHLLSPDPVPLSEPVDEPPALVEPPVPCFIFVPVNDMDCVRNLALTVLNLTAPGYPPVPFALLPANRSLVGTYPAGTI